MYWKELEGTGKGRGWILEGEVRESERELEFGRKGEISLNGDWKWSWNEVEQCWNQWSDERKRLEAVYMEKKTRRHELFLKGK